MKRLGAVTTHLLQPVAVCGVVDRLYGLLKGVSKLGINNLAAFYDNHYSTAI